jgi:hypothetical protein
MLQRRISNNKSLPRLIALVDERLGQPHGAYAVIVYTWAIAHLDVEGRMHGDPDVVKGQVVPRIAGVTPELLREYLSIMAEVGLVTYYAADDDLWLEFPAFEDSQPNLRKDREAKSSIPAPSSGVVLGAMATPEQCRSFAGVPPELLPHKRREEKLREEKIPSPPSAALELIPSAPRLDLDALYAPYPRKEGKAKGMAKLKRVITTPAQYERFAAAVRNYAKHVAGRPADKVKHFDSFVTCWEDYADGLPFVASVTGNGVVRGHARATAKYDKTSDGTGDL